RVDRLADRDAERPPEPRSPIEIERVRAAADDDHRPEARAPDMRRNALQPEPHRPTAVRDERPLYRAHRALRVEERSRPVLADPRTQVAERDCRVHGRVVELV